MYFIYNYVLLYYYTNTKIVYNKYETKEGVEKVVLLLRYVLHI